MERVKLKELDLKISQLNEWSKSAMARWASPIIQTAYWSSKHKFIEKEEAYR